MVYPSLTPSSSAVVPFPSIQPRPGPERVREAVRPFLHLLNADVKGRTALQRAGLWRLRHRQRNRPDRSQV